jgi:hypothetical protein
MPITLAQIPTISAGDTEVAAVDFTDLLDTGETLTGTPTVVEVTTTALTLANKAISTSSLVILDRVVATGHAVQFKVTGQVATHTYRIRITATTTSTPARVLVRDVLFNAI